MKVEIIETLNFPSEIIFAVITDIPHHVDWVEEPVELVSLSDGPAKLGTKWEQNAERLGRKLVTLNVCNIYEKNKKFGWVSKKPFSTQVTLLLEPKGNSTRLCWMIESEEVGIVQLAEPLLIKQANTMIQKSLVRLKAYLQCHAIKQREKYIAALTPSSTLGGCEACSAFAKRSGWISSLPARSAILRASFKIR